MFESFTRLAPFVQRLGAWLAWWMLLAGTWMLLVDTRSVAEFAAGGGVSLLALLLTWLVARQHVADMRLRGSLLWHLSRQALGVPFDLWLLARELAKALSGRHPGGRFYSLPFEGDADPAANGRRAAIDLIGSLAPNTLVLGADERQVVVHQLAAHAPARRRIEEMAR
jgi:multisubunit Na+/H+ antiporter MnhE subunit